MITSEAREVLSALIDREPVDPDVLAMVLEDAGARAMLVDFVRLRRLVETETGEHSIEPFRAAGARTRRDPARLAAAAALVVLSVGLGGWWLLDTSSGEEPPTPARVLRFERGVDWVDNVPVARLP